MRGFSLPELLAATLIAVMVSGALLLVVSPVRGMFQAQVEATDLQQRLRATVSAIAGDLLMAGAGSTAGGNPGPLTSAEPAVLPYRHGLLNDDPRAGIFFRRDAITVRYVASTPSQPTVVSHTYYLRADAASRAFQLMHYDGVRGDFPMIDNVILLEFDYFGDPRPPTSIAPPAAGVDVDGTDEYPAGENCLFLRSEGTAIPRLPALAPDVALVRLDTPLMTDGPWCPGAASADRFDADLLRIRNVTVRVRLQAGQASLRGPAGALFARGGSATTPYSYVPDQEIRFDVTPRNLGSGR